MEAISSSCAAACAIPCWTISATNCFVAAFEHFGDAVKYLPAVVGGCPSPRPLGIAGGDHRVAEILARALADVGQRLVTAGVFQRVVPA